MNDSLPTNEPSADPAALRCDTLADSVVFLLALTVFQRMIGFGRSVLFCRWLEPRELGQWDMAFGFLLLIAPLAVLGLPGSFGRYLEHFHQRGHLRTFLRRTTMVSAALVSAAVAALWLLRDTFTHLVFGTGELAGIMALIAAGLVVLVGYNLLMELFTAMRMARVVAAIRLLNSLAFAVLAVILLQVWRTDATSIVLAYIAASLVSCLAAAFWLRRAWRSIPAPTQSLPQRPFWSKLAPFAAWVWVSNVLWNLFDVVDRYMIVHFAPVGPDEALAEVGHYHSSRVVPILLVAVAGMLAGVITPHLSRDWESGRRERVSARLNLALKLLALAMTAVAATVLLAAPLLFEYAFAGKYSGGLYVLPWTLTYCIWLGMGSVANNYLWCAERARLGCLAMAVGLAGNVALNLLLLPRLGLLGAVLATTAANAIALSLIFTFSRMLGMRISAGLLLVSLLPLTLALGPAAAWAVLLAVALMALRGNWIFERDEKRQLAELWRRYAATLLSLRNFVSAKRNNVTHSNP